MFGLDHLISEQEAAPEEIAAINEWLKREAAFACSSARTTTVGFTSDMKQRQMEYEHHGDALVPRQQRFGQYTRSLMKALNVPVINQYGLHPAVVKGSSKHRATPPPSATWTSSSFLKTSPRSISIPTCRITS